MHLAQPTSENALRDHQWRVWLDQPLLTRQLPRDEQQHPAAVAIDMTPATEQFLTPAQQDCHSRRS